MIADGNLREEKEELSDGKKAARARARTEKESSNVSFIFRTGDY